MAFHRLILCGALCLASLAFAHPGQHEQLARINLAIEREPGNQALHMQRGMIYSNGGQFEQASADYARAEALGPPIAVAYELGILHYRMGDFERATDYLDLYIKQFPSFAAAYDYRARVARDAGDYDRAIADLSTYFRLHDSPHPGHYISAANMLQAQGETDQALAVLDQGMDKLGVTPQLQRQAIELELARQQLGNAITRLDALRVPLQQSTAWKLDMAELLLLAARRPEAQSLVLEAATELNASRPTPARLALLQRSRELQSRLAVNPVN